MENSPAFHGSGTDGFLCSVSAHSITTNIVSKCVQTERQI